jgi:hypothetical protein
MTMDVLNMALMALGWRHVQGARRELQPVH